MKNILTYCFLAAVTAGGCTKDVTLKPGSHPFVITEKAGVSEEGATFYADLKDLGETNITRHGFIWIHEDGSEGPFFEREIEVDGVAESGIYSANINTGLEAGQTYEVKAFVETASYTVFGNTVSLYSMGCIQPQISSFNPTFGRTGTRVVILGTNFSPYKEDNYVCIGVKTLILEEVQADRIVVVIPNVTKPLTGPISLVTAGMTVTTQQSFEIRYP
jgi:hypothetical protein